MDLIEASELKRLDFRKNAEENMDAVTQRLKNHRKLGKKFFEKAMAAMLRNNTKEGNKLIAFLRYDDAATYFFKSSVHFQACGKWREAADSLAKCAEMYFSIGSFLEAATIFSQSAELYMMVDKNEGYNVYKRAITIYCNIGRFDVSGKLERTLGLIDYHHKHYEDAAEHFKRAANFLSGELLLDQSDLCLEKCVDCLFELHKYDDARRYLEMIAHGCVQSNLRRFNAVDYLLKAALCLCTPSIDYGLPPVPKKVKGPHVQSVDAEGEKTISEKSSEKYEMILKTMRDMNSIDYLWTASKEFMFLNNIIQYRRSYDRDSFLDHVYYYYNARDLDKHSLKMIKYMHDEIVWILHRRHEVKERYDTYMEKKKERLRKIEETKKLMQEMGVEGEVKVEDEDEESHNEEHEVLNVGEIVNTEEITANEDSDSDDMEDIDPLLKQKMKEDDEEELRQKPERRKRTKK